MYSDRRSELLFKKDHDFWGRRSTHPDWDLFGNSWEKIKPMDDPSLFKFHRWEMDGNGQASQAVGSDPCVLSGTVHPLWEDTPE